MRFMNRIGATVIKVKAALSGGLLELGDNLDGLCGRLESLEALEKGRFEEGESSAARTDGPWACMAWTCWSKAEALASSAASRVVVCATRRSACSRALPWLLAAVSSLH